MVASFTKIENIARRDFMGEGEAGSVGSTGCHRTRGYSKGAIDSMNLDLSREVWIGNREWGVIRSMAPGLNKVKREEKEQNFQGMPAFKG